MKHPVALYLMTTARSVDDPFEPWAARSDRRSGESRFLAHVRRWFRFGGAEHVRREALAPAGPAA